MTIDTRERIAAEARAWLGTPYHRHACIKGIGVDCAQILIAVYASVGLVDQIDAGNYASDWHLHRREEVYVDWLDRYGERIERAQVQLGDVALFKFDLTHSHSGIVVGTNPLTFVHAYAKTRRVELTRIDEAPFDGRAVLFWSIAR